MTSVKVAAFFLAVLWALGAYVLRDPMWFWNIERIEARAIAAFAVSAIIGYIAVLFWGS